MEKRPYIPIADMAVTFVVELFNLNVVGDALIAVTYGLLKEWGVTLEEVYQTAVDNIRKIPFHFVKLHEIVDEMSDEELALQYGCPLEEVKYVRVCQEADSLMYVLTFCEQTNGASVILNPDAMDEVRRKIGENFYLLPSSVHEWIVFDATRGADTAALSQMVTEVNVLSVPDEEQLSDGIYSYDFKNRCLKKIV